MINVFILTFCRKLDLFYGTELIFKTLRVGFPNARVTVVDNASLPEAREAVKELARKNDCIFKQILDPGLQHHEFLSKTLRAVGSDGTSEGPLIFLDPDMCFWKNCEDFYFEGFIAGRFIARFQDHVTQTVTMPRLHTSFLWIPHARKLMDEIRKIQVLKFEFLSFMPFCCRIEEDWYRFNTGAGLCAAIPHRISVFTEAHLDCYDHIFCGSHLDVLFGHYDSEIREMMSRIHGFAKEGDLDRLKGIWRYQLTTGKRATILDGEEEMS